MLRIYNAGAAAREPRPGTTSHVPAEAHRRVLDRQALERGLPRVRRTDHGKACCGRAMLTWAHAQIVIEAWRREYNEDRPKKGLGGLTPAHDARQLVTERSTLTPGLSTGPLLKSGGTSL